MKSLLLFLCFVGVVSCNNDVFEVSDTTVNSQFSNDDELTAVADLSLSFVNQLAMTRGSDNNVQIKSVYAINRNDFFPPSRFTKDIVGNMPDTLMYVVNFSGKNGFALVSTDIRTFGILAYVENGSYSPNGNTENQGFLFYMDCLREYFLNAYKKESPPTESYRGGESMHVTIDSLETCFLNTKWGQYSPFNWYCFNDNGANEAVGCVPIAMGQIIAKHRYPSSFRGYSFDWDYISDDSIPSITSQQISVAHLLAEMRDIMGVVRDSMGHVGTDISHVTFCFDSLGYQHSFLTSYNSSDFSNCMNEFANGRPVYFRGATSLSSNGHSWVLDGGLVNSIHVLKPEGYGVIEVRIYINRMLHCNWGYYGNYNGYFLDVSFDPDGSGSMPLYNTALQWIYNICPIN